MPNQQQAENQEPQKAQNDNVERRPEYFDDPPPVIKAEGANESGEGDDGAGFDNADQENEGEGNKTAGRNYNKGVQKHLKTKDVEKEAEDAADALEDEDERKDLEDAEEAARKGQIH